MKNLIIILVILFGHTIYAQNGIAKPVLGAHWNDGARGAISKYIHYNVHQAGIYDVAAHGRTYKVEVNILGNELLLFDEYASHNRNWVSAPNGKLWKFIGEGQLFLAECGNKVRSINTQEGLVRNQPFYRDVDLSPINERLDRIETNLENSMDNQNDMYALMQQMAMCQGAWSQFEVINVNYQTRGSLRSAQEKLDHLKMQYPCLPQDLTIERAHKGWQWAKQNAVGLANLGLNIGQTVQLEQIKNRKVTVRTINNSVVGPGHNPNANIPGHNGNGAQGVVPGRQYIGTYSGYESATIVGVNSAYRVRN